MKPSDYLAEWTVSEDEPGLAGVVAAFAVFALFLLVIFVYVVVMTP